MRLWPGYRRWFLSRQRSEPPSLAASKRQLERQMPELAPLWRELRSLASETGSGDLAARFLTLYRPPPFLTGCSLLATSDPETGEPLLVRNYDYDPALWEATLWHTRWGGRGVTAISDCLWGALDGVNDDGLAVALAFGGRRVVGDGFGVPLIVRWLLQSCSDIGEAERALRRVQCHMAYNLLLVDARGEHLAVELAPDREPRFSKQRAVTNHQGPGGDWPSYERISHTHERVWRLEELLASCHDLTSSDSLRSAFATEPLLASDLERSFATLYTAVWRPARGTGEVHVRETPIAEGATA